jgi:transcription elongation factor GreA
MSLTTSLSPASGSTVMLTAEGLQQLQGELCALQERRASLSDAFAAAPEDAGGVQTDLVLADRRITEIEAVLARAMVLDETDRVPGVVGIGSRVTVHWEEDGEETYTIVEPAEVALDAGRISHESPVGQALFGQRAGDRVAVETLLGPAWLKVVSVD